MSTINFRLYGDQIYGLASKYLTEYITPDINKEEFVTNFKNGKLDLNITNLKKPITIAPHILIKESKVEKIEINIPDEKENFIFKLSKLKVMIKISQINDMQIESLIIEKRKKLIEKFIKETINKIEKKEKSSFLKGLLDSFVKRALNGLIIEMNDIDIFIRCNNYLLLLKINKILYNENEGIKINDINLIYNDMNNTSNKTDIIKKFNIGIIINSSKDNNIANSLKINVSDIYFEINSNMYIGIMKFIQIFDDINYKKRYLRYKKLIEYRKPKKINDKQQYYRLLWFWAIKTVIKLQKYKTQEKLYIFDLINCKQIKYSKRYIYSDEKKDNNDNDKKDNSDNNNNINNDDYLILPEEIILLQSTKDKVEKQLLENKKGNQLANAFKFFFGGGGDEQKNELTEEEKQSLNDAFTRESIINYLVKKKYNNENDNNKKEEENMIDKFKNFFNNISFDITFNQIEILLNYFYSKRSLYLKNINTIIDINNKNNNKSKNFQVIIGDIGYDQKYSIFKNIIKEKENQMIKFIKNDNISEIIFGFNNLEINGSLIIFIINFYFSLFYTSEERQNKFFIKENLDKKDKKTNNILSIIDTIKIPSYIPSINIVSNINNSCICFNIIDLIINKTLINFKINIKDNKSNCIIDNYELKIIKNEENTKFDLTLNDKLKIIMPKEASDLFFMFLFEVNKLKQHYQIIQFVKNSSQNNKEKLLYGFINIYKKLNIEESLLNAFDFNLFIKGLSLEIYENISKTILSICNLTLNYKNKKLLFKLGTFNLSLDITAPKFLFMIKLKSPYINEFEQLLSQKIQKDFNLDINEELLNKKNFNNEIAESLLYHKTNAKLINQLFDSLKIYITEIKIYYKAENNIFLLFLNKTIGDKKENSILFKTETNGFNYANNNNFNHKTIIMEMKENLYWEFNFMKSELYIKSKTPTFIINEHIIKLIRESFDLMIDRKKLKKLFQKVKIKAEIINTSLIVDKFIFNLSQIDIRNYKDFLTKHTIFMNISSILMKRNDNNNGLVLMKEKMLEIKFVYSPKTEKTLSFQSSDLNMMLSQDDLFQFVSSFSFIYIYIRNEYKKRRKKMIIDSPDKIRNIDIIFSLPKTNLNLCTNDYKKIGELLFTSTSAIIKIYYIENINKNNEYLRQSTYTVLINNIILKYIDFHNNELVLLQSGIDKNNEKTNHISFYCQNKKNIILNIFKSKVILRSDSYYFLYHYFKAAIPLKEIKNKINSYNKNNQVPSYLSELKINFDYTKVLIPSDFNNNENLSFNVEKFLINFNSINNSKFPIGKFGVNLFSISSTITSNNITRRLFNTNNNFLSVAMTLEPSNLNLIVSLNSMIINLSYTDITAFLRVYYLNKILIKNTKQLLNQDNNNRQNNNNIIMPNNEENNHNFLRRISRNILTESTSFSGNFNFINFNITLIDNSSGSYYPFAKLNLRNINLECLPDTTITSNFSLLLSSYNYISCVWEPTIEKSFFNFRYRENIEIIQKNKNFEIDVQKMNINISDMSISFTLNTLNKWIKKLIENKKTYKNNEYGIGKNALIDFKKSISQSLNITKISNNKLINYTGINLYIKYANNTYTCEPNNQIELEYINEWDVKRYGPKQLNLAVNNQTNFLVPIEKICTRSHQINNNLYLITENILSKERQININVYSPVIFKNKSLYDLQVHLQNQQKGYQSFYLNRNSCIGLPLYYYEPNTFICFTFPNEKPKSTDYNFTLYEIVNNNNDNQINSKNIIIDNTILLMSISRKIPKVNTILINCEYMIINYLPCNICVNAKGKDYIIEKNSQQYIDFYSGNDSEIRIQISVDNIIYASKPKKLFQKVPKENGNFLKFKSTKNALDCFKLSYLIKKKSNKKVLAIYADSILENKSGFDFYIKSKNLCLQIAPNLYLISSKIDVKTSKFIIKDDFYGYTSNNICLEDILQASPSYVLDLKPNKIINKYSSPSIRLIICNSISNVYLKNQSTNKYNIITTIYQINSSYRITNLLSTKKFIIASQENPDNIITIEPMSQMNFDFFHKGVDIPLMFSVNNLSNYNFDNINSYAKFTSPFTLKDVGTYTFRIDDNMFNLEIRQASAKGITDVFVVETNFDNAKIIIDNNTNNNCFIYQMNYKYFNQNISANSKQILHIYDQKCMTFFYQLGGCSGLFEFKPLEVQQEKQDIGNNITMCLESNGIKMKISFYNKNIFDNNQDYKENINYCVRINEVLVSIIADNEFKDKKLRNYERKELLLLEMNQLLLEIKWDKNIGLLGKDIINTTLLLEKMNLYNQSNNENIRYINALNNISSPCISLNFSIYHFKNDNIWKISSLNLLLGNLRLNIDPIFIDEIIDFITNIIYRMKIKNYNVNKIFLIEDNYNTNKGLNLNAYQDKIKEYIELYNKKGLLFHGVNFELPILSLVFLVTKNGLEKLLTDKFGCSSVYIWAAKGLTDQRHSINLSTNKIESYMGDFKGIIKLIIQRYKTSLKAKLVNIGIKGFFANFSKIIKDENVKKFGKKIIDIFNKQNNIFGLNKNNNNTIQNDFDEYECNMDEIYDPEQFIRKRKQRAFYEKFKYFKEFNEDDAYYFDMIPKKLGNTGILFIFTNLIRENNNNLYVFTTSALLMMSSNFEVYNIIYYFCVDNVNRNHNQVNIKFNQSIDGRFGFEFNAENEEIANRVCNILIEETAKNKDNFNDI